jgi:hypothetical protein
MFVIAKVGQFASHRCGIDIRKRPAFLMSPVLTITLKKFYLEESIFLLVIGMCDIHLVSSLLSVHRLGISVCPVIAIWNDPLLIFGGFAE